MSLAASGAAATRGVLAPGPSLHLQDMHNVQGRDSPGVSQGVVSGVGKKH